MRSRHRRRAIAAALLCACAWPAPEARADGQRILFVAPTPTPFSARVRAEIEAMGFTVEPTEALDDARAPTAVAAARVLESPPPRRVELWIVDTPRGRFELRTVIQPSSTDDEETQIVRASEELRAFFQPLRERSPAPALPPGPPLPHPPPYSAPPPTAAPLSPASPEPAPAPAPAPRFMAGASLAVPIEPGGPGVDLELRARWMATRVLGVGAMVSVPMAGPTVTAAQGSASLSASIFGAEVSAIFLDARLLRLGASAGFAVAWLRTSGFARTPYTGGDTSLVTGLPFVGVEIAPRITDRLRLCLGADAAIAAPGAEIAFAGHVVASWARPLGLFSGGVSVDF